MTQVKRTILSIAIFLSGALIVSIGGSQIRFIQVRNALQARLEIVKTEQVDLKDQYMAEKEIVAKEQRVQMTLMSERRAVAQERDRLESERQTMISENEALWERIREQEKVLVSWEEARTRHQQRFDELHAEYQGLQQTFEEAVLTHENQKEQLLTEKVSLEDDLEMSNYTLDMAIETNERLRAIAGEVLEKYAFKGFTGTILPGNLLTERDAAELDAIRKEYSRIIGKLCQEDADKGQES
jgi:hypothetical protein